MSKLSLYDFRDLDLMLAVGDNGGVTTGELAETIGFGKEIPAVAVRLAWMRRYGIFDREDGLWSLSDGGVRVLRAHTKAAKTASIERVPDEALVDVMANVMTRYRHGDPVNATLLRREFLYGTRPR